MEFKVNSKELEKLLSKVFPAIPTRTPVQILENFLFVLEDGVLTVFGTDLELSLKSSVSVVSDGNLKAVIPARFLFDAIKSLDDTTLIIKTDERNKMTITWESGEFHISYQNANEYPEIPAFPNQELDEEITTFSIKGTDLKYAIDKTSFALSKEEIRVAMMGTLFEFSEEGLKFVSTDGHRLVELEYKNVKVQDEVKFIVPANTTAVLNKILDEREVKVYFNKSHVSFILNDIELIARLIAEQYPDYRSVIPLENEFLLKVNPKVLATSTKRMMLISPSKTRKVRWNIQADSLEISSEDVDLGASGKEKITCKYQGDAMEIGFNAGYVSEVLSHLSENEEIEFKLHSPNKAVILYPVKQKENYELQMLLMPVRLNG